MENKIAECDKGEGAMVVACPLKPSHKIDKIVRPGPVAVFQGESRVSESQKTDHDDGVHYPMKMVQTHKIGVFLPFHFSALLRHSLIRSIQDRGNQRMVWIEKNPKTPRRRTVMKSQT
ncbi:MAG: hypothetical protein A4E65_02708 [Syntrophorhabdus sp. PtaU1.Bin153]|nr:MAG: hypothetical protein A4E65_02708 [Syntrophorhabdus sp. PtaU1.Bin153]